MSFTGELIRVGSYLIPNSIIALDTYDCTPDQRQDVDSYRDLNQDLHRNVADHYKSVVKFQSRNGLAESVIRPVIEGIQSNYTNVKERKVHLQYFNTDTGSYSSGDFYLVQPQYKVIRIDGTQLYYGGINFEFIEY